MSPPLEGRHAVITGAGRGIGRGAALALASDGARVTLIARTSKDLQAVADEISMMGGTARVVQADVRECDVVDAALARAAKEQPLDILVTAAGINRPGQLADMAVDDLRAMLDINVLGTLIACRAFARTVIGTGRGAAIVTLSSQMGVVGYPGRAPYCATKHAVNGLTKALALEWAPHGIRVNAVAPTFIQTPLTAPMFEDESFRADVLARIPAGRIGEVEDVVSALRFLVSDAAGLITGHVLAVDGGWTAQ